MMLASSLSTKSSFTHGLLAPILSSGAPSVVLFSRHILLLFVPHVVMTLYSSLSWPNTPRPLHRSCSDGACRKALWFSPRALLIRGSRKTRMCSISSSALKTCKASTQRSIRHVPGIRRQQLWMHEVPPRAAGMFLARILSKSGIPLSVVSTALLYN